MVDKQVKVRLVMDGGRVVEAQLEGIGTKGKVAMDDLGKASGAMRGNLQNASYQVQDFFVQVAAGTDPVRALSMQLPQLLGSLGLIGVLAGTAAAALIPLAGNLLGIGEDSATAEEAIRSLAESTNTLNEIAGANLEKLREKYGQVNAEILLMLTRRLNVERDLAAKGARDAVSAVAGEFEGLATKIAAYSNFKADFDRLSAQQDQGVDNTESLLILQDAMAGVEEQIGLTFDQMQQLQGALDAYSGADTMAEQASSASALLGVLEQLGLATEPFYAALQSSEEELRAVNQASMEAHATVLDLASAAPGSGWMSDAMASVSGLIGKLASAVGLRNALAGTAFEVTGDGPSFERGGRMGSTSAPYVAPQKTLDELLAVGSTGGGCGGGGGGVSEAQKEQNDLMREAERLYTQTRTDAEKYTEEVANLDQMLKAGLIDQELYNRGLSQAAERYGEASGAAGFFKEMNIDIKKTFVDLALEGGNALDGLIDKLKRAALEAMFFGTGPIADLIGLGAGGIFGDGFTGVLSGALAGGGPVERGRAYRVGERGPELFVPGSNGNILPIDPQSSRKIESGAPQQGGGGGTSRLQVELSDGLVASILDQAAQQAVDIVQRAIGANNRHALPSLVRGTQKNPRRA